MKNYNSFSIIKASKLKEVSHEKEAITGSIGFWYGYDTPS